MPTRGSPPGKTCCAGRDIHDARRVADMLYVPFYALNFDEQFDRIVDYFVDEYLVGRTPNPCVVCNTWLKFGKLHATGQICIAAKRIILVESIAQEFLDRATKMYRLAMESEFYEPYLDGYGFYTAAKDQFEASQEAITAENPDVIIVAAGAEPIIPKIDGISGENVVWAGDVDTGRAATGVSSWKWTYPVVPGAITLPSTGIALAIASAVPVWNLTLW